MVLTPGTMERSRRGDIMLVGRDEEKLCQSGHMRGIVWHVEHLGGGHHAVGPREVGKARNDGSKQQEGKPRPVCHEVRGNGVAKQCTAKNMAWGLGPNGATYWLCDLDNHFILLSLHFPICSENPGQKRRETGQGDGE